MYLRESINVPVNFLESEMIIKKSCHRHLRSSLDFDFTFRLMAKADKSIIKVKRPVRFTYNPTTPAGVAKNPVGMK